MFARLVLLRLGNRCPGGAAAVRHPQVWRPPSGALVSPLPWRPLHLTTRHIATAEPSTAGSAEKVTSLPQSDRPPLDLLTVESQPPSPPSPSPDHHEEHHDDTAQPPNYTHQFDTYHLVIALEAAGYTRPQAIALMKCLRTTLGEGIEFAKSHYLSPSDLENETYLFRAAMSELRTEVKTIRHNEAVAERAEVITLQKALEALNQQTKEDLENLRNDVTIEMNNRKIASRAEQQAMEVKIQDLNYGFTKRLADMRTEAEAQKWQTTRLLIVTLVMMIVSGLGVTRYLQHRQRVAQMASEGTQTESGDGPDPHAPPSSDLVTLG